MSLRERGIYCLPNGRELIVVANAVDRSIKMRGWQRSELSEYELDPGGKLLASGKLTAWDTNDLTDTGRTANESSDMLRSE